MSDFDFLYEGEGLVVVEEPPKRPRKKRKKKSIPPHDMIPIPWRNTGKRTHNKGAHFEGHRGVPRRPEWTTSKKQTRHTLRSAATVLGIVERLDTEWGVRLFQWEVSATGEVGEYMDVRSARKAVEKRTLVGHWAHLYNPRGGGIK